MNKKKLKYLRTIQIDGKLYDNIKTYAKSNGLCIKKWVEKHLTNALEIVTGK